MSSVVKNVLVVGGGLMGTWMNTYILCATNWITILDYSYIGAGIAQVAASTGHKVALTDVSQSVLDGSMLRERMTTIWTKAVVLSKAVKFSYTSTCWRKVYTVILKHQTPGVRELVLPWYWGTKMNCNVRLGNCFLLVPLHWYTSHSSLRKDLGWTKFYKHLGIMALTTTILPTILVGN